MHFTFIAGVAQYAPNVFWNSVRLSHSSGSVQDFLYQLIPEEYKTGKERFRNSRKRVSYTGGTQLKSNKNKERKTAKVAEEGYNLYMKKYGREVTQANTKKLENMKESVFNQISSDMEERHELWKLHKKHFCDKPIRDIKRETQGNLVQALLNDGGFPRCRWASLSYHELDAAYMHCIQHNYNAPLYLKLTEKKGRGVFAAEDIYESHFVLQYKGEHLASRALARMREDKHVELNFGCYQWEIFNPMRQRTEVIDSTAEKAYNGAARLVNHSRKNANVTARKILNLEEKKVHLVFVAKRDIAKDEEILVDYGDRRPEVVQANQWLND